MPDAEMEVPQSRHFWDQNEACGLFIANLATKSHEELLNRKDNYCLNMWAAIGPVYFPDHDPTDTGQPTYAITLQPNRALLAQLSEDQRLHVLVIRSFTHGNVLPPVTQERDVLWIVCKAPEEDAPHGWKDLMNEAAARLHATHPNRRVFLILASGFKWIPFLWDPPNQTVGMAPLNPDVPRLIVLGHDNQVPTDKDWLCDDRIVPVPHDMLPGQNHVGAQSVPHGELGAGRLPIDTTQAYSIRAWDEAGNVTNMGQLKLLENLLALIRGHRFADLDPPVV